MSKDNSYAVAAKIIRYNERYASQWKYHITLQLEDGRTFDAEVSEKVYLDLTSRAFR